MFADAPVEFAIQGERGIDLFRRQDDTAAKRARFECIGCVLTTPSGTEPNGTEVLDFSASALDTPSPKLAQLAATLADDPVLDAPFRLGDLRSWPSVTQSPDPLRPFLYLEFFRAWQIADIALRRFLTQIETDPNTLPATPHALPQAVTPAFQFNRLELGTRMARLALPVLSARLEQFGNAQDAVLGVGYALRMLGDIALRAADFDLALACFEMSVAYGDNQHRRRKTLETAYLMGDPEIFERLASAFEARWGQAEWLTQIRQNLSGSHE